MNNVYAQIFSTTAFGFRILNFRPFILVGELENEPRVFGAPRPVSHCIRPRDVHERTCRAEGVVSGISSVVQEKRALHAPRAYPGAREAHYAYHRVIS